MKKITFLLLLLVSVTMLKSQNEAKHKKRLAFSGYSGGVMVNTGYVFGKTFSIYDDKGAFIKDMKMSGVPFGIGGAARVRFGKHLRVGGEGYITKLKSDNLGSTSQIFWGGALVDYSWSLKKTTMFVGGTIGGGNARTLVLLKDTPTDFIVENNSTLVRNYAFMAISPFIGMEQPLGAAISLVIKVDYILNASNSQLDFVTGPRIYFGVMFTH